MKCLIVDDEVLARSRLKAVLADIDVSLNVIEAENGQDALNKCQDYQPELVFLDIRMPGMSGIEVAHHLTNFEKVPIVIFTTAYNEFALEAFDANALDYLLKPIRRERLKRALKKVHYKKPLIKIDIPHGEPRLNFALRAKGNIRLVPLGDVIYFRADDKLVKLRTVDGEHLVSEVLNSLEQELQDQFIRVHRNALVSKAHIAGLEKDDVSGNWLIHFKSIDETLEVSRRQITHVRKWLQKLS